MPRSFELPEKPSIIVTGASSGIGEATAYRFAQAGARIALLARREDRLKAAADRVRELGGQAHVVLVDLADFERAKKAATEAETLLGGVDVLVNNAGFGVYAPLESVPRSDLERLFSVNVYGALACAQAVLPGMRRRGRGVIINVSSVVGKRALPMTGAYGATKYALQGLSDALRVELRGTGVKVSVVCPGYTTSEFSDKVVDYGASERVRRRSGAMSSEEVADAIFRCARSPRRQVVLTGKGHLLVFLERFAPGVLDWIVARAIPVKLPELGPLARGDRP